MTSFEPGGRPVGLPLWPGFQLVCVARFGIVPTPVERLFLQASAGELALF
jgi:hypothetical protein